jgi:hypothetical protein
MVIGLWLFGRALTDFLGPFQNKFFDHGSLRRPR